MRAVLAVVVAVLLCGPAVAAGQVCKVTDPTGTPLNVRASPGGEIVGTIGNGRDVEIIDDRSDARGRSWALIRQPGAASVMGWVFREFVSCYR